MSDSTADKFRQNLQGAMGQAAAGSQAPTGSGDPGSATPYVRPSPVLASAPKNGAAQAPRHGGDRPLRRESQHLLATDEPKPEPAEAPPAPSGKEQKLASAAETAQQRLAALKNLGTIPVKFRHAEVEVTPEQLIESHQKVLSLGNVEQKRKEMQADVQGYNAYVELRNRMQKDPHFRKGMEALWEGRGVQPPAAPAAPQRPAASGDPDDDETPMPTSRGVDPAMAALMEQMASRLERLEQFSQDTASRGQRRDFEHMLDQAVNEDATVRSLQQSSPEEAKNFAAIVRDAAAARIHTGEFETPEQAVPLVVAEYRTAASLFAETQRKARERSASEFRTPPATSGSPFMADLAALRETAPNVPGGFSDRSGLKASMKEWARSMMRAQTSG